MTNIERIKSMESGELAAILMCPFEFDESFKKEQRTECTLSCIACVKKWLEKEYEKDKSNY